jgi:iron-sulfur cluster repair protein YtfE (RIC family)
LQCAQHLKKIKDLLQKYAEAQDALADWEELYNDLRTEEYRQRTGQLPA